MNIKTEYELVKARGVELNPDEDFNVQLFGAWKYLRNELRFWRVTSVALSCAVLALLFVRS